MPSGIGTVVRDLLADLQEGRGGGGGGGVDARRMDGLKMGCMARSFQRLGKWERLLMTGRWKGTKSVRVLFQMTTRVAMLRCCTVCRRCELGGKIEVDAGDAGDAPHMEI